MAPQPPLILTPETLHSHFAEAYRTLRANIRFGGVDQPVKTIVVTSALPSEGKTTTVINLGIVMAQAGPRVLVVDADFRNPSIQGVRGLCSSQYGRQQLGLSDVMTGGARLENAIVETSFERLCVVPSGTRPLNPSELLGSQRLQAVVSELKSRADFVLFDSPPCLTYSDAFLISHLTDGVLYVLRAGSQEKATQRRVQKRLQQANVRLLGVVLNDLDVERHGRSERRYHRNGRKPRK